MQNVDFGALLLMLISASAYVVSAYFMKLYATQHGMWLAGLITLTLLIGVVCELIVLKTEKMGQVYFIIIAFECLLVAAFAKLALNESYSVAEVVGLLLIVAGVAVFQLPEMFSSQQPGSVRAAATSQPIKASVSQQLPLRRTKANKLSTAL